MPVSFEYETEILKKLNKIYDRLGDIGDIKTRAEYAYKGLGFLLELIEVSPNIIEIKSLQENNSYDVIHNLAYAVHELYNFLEEYKLEPELGKWSFNRSITDNNRSITDPYKELHRNIVKARGYIKGAIISLEFQIDSKKRIKHQPSPVAQPIESPEREQMRLLRQILTTRFNEEELRDLCFDLGVVTYDSLSGEGQAGKARELVTYFERRDRIPELVKMIRELRSDVSC